MACQTECVWKGPESSACPFLCTRSSLKAQSGLRHVGHIVARWFVLKEHQHLKAKWDGHQAVVAVFWHHLRRRRRRRRRFIRRLEIRPSVKDKLQLQRRKSIKVVLASFLQCNKIRRHVISIDETPLNSQKTTKRGNTEGEWMGVQALCKFIKPLSLAVLAVREVRQVDIRNWLFQIFQFQLLHW